MKKKKAGLFLFYYVIFCSSSSVFVVANNLPSSVMAPHSWELFGFQPMLSTTTCSSTSYSAAPSFSLGFYNLQLQILLFHGSPTDPQDPVVVWYADVSHPLGDFPTIGLTATTGLSMKAADGQILWSSNTSNSEVRVVSSMKLTCHGNLVLLNPTGGVVWQSFDHPTDTWLPRQTLYVGQTLRVSNGNISADDHYYISVGNDALHAFLNTTNQPTEYAHLYYIYSPRHFQCQYLSSCSNVTFLEHDNHVAYLRLTLNGHLNYYSYNTSEYFQESWLQVVGGSECGYPRTCGNYGVCFDSNVCNCPTDVDDGKLNYFRQVDPSRPYLGCNLITALECPDTHKLHTLLRLENVTYFDFESYKLAGVYDTESCKAACMKNCSCKAALFQYGGEHISSGHCSLPTELLTLMHLDPEQSGYNSIAFIEVKMPGKETKLLMQKLVPAISVTLFIALCIAVGYYVMVMRRKFDPRETECSSDLIIDTITRFSFESLKLATHDFKNRLGRGGFGCVFEGTLEDGAKVAVKRLESVGQGRKEFLAEVNTIGNLHHYNLVRLIGFCDDGLNRLLVYEFMPNGSLDKWIFQQHLAQTLTWGLRRKIIDGIAKGLEYLHENCLQNVIHFDIKPQNILLDKDFNVKISDFGLAKLVDRDQSQVMTIIKGTPGYIAPELITAQVISVKVDVYSFGVLILEIVCGRRNSGSSVGDVLIDMVKVKADEDWLSELIDGRVEDMQQHKEEAVKMMKVAIWCLQPHFIRPNMSMVVKVLQDSPNMDALSDLSYLTMVHEATPAENVTRPTDSLLSGPR